MDISSTNGDISPIAFNSPVPGFSYPSDDFESENLVLSPLQTHVLEFYPQESGFILE